MVVEPPKWDPEKKDFSVWLREATAWKIVTMDLKGMKDNHAIILTLKFPEGSEIREHLFESFSVDEMKGEDGWTAVIGLVEEHFKKEGSINRFMVWRDFINMKRKESQSVDEYILCYEKNRKRLQSNKMALDDELQAYILLDGARLSSDDLKIAMRELDNDKPNEMYSAAKKALKKYFGKGAISTLAKGNDDGEEAIKVVMHGDRDVSDQEEWESFAAWRKWKNGPVGNKRGFGRTRGYDGGRYRNKPVLERVNPKGSDGNIMSCHACQSIAHLVRYCPHKIGQSSKGGENFSNINNVNFGKSDDVSKEKDITIIREESPFVECDVSLTQSSKTLSYAILDTGCPTNVSGTVWADCYVQSLDIQQKKEVVKSPSNTKFKFGGGEVMTAVYRMEIPVLIAGKAMRLSFDVVEGNLPLLLGKNTMKKWNVVIKAAEDIAIFSIDGTSKCVELFTSGSSHWCIDIRPGLPLEAVSSFFSLEGLDMTEKKSAALHLHRQFCHPTFEFMKKALSVFDECNDEFLRCLKNVSDDCKICKIYKPALPRPIVGRLPDPEKMKFNFVVSLDLKERNGCWILYMIDMVTRYTRAKFVPNKKKETIVATIIELWISLFGAPSTLYSDNGGEFANKELLELGNQFGIVIKHTAAYSPWSNGLNERNHATVDYMMDKIIADLPKISKEMALNYAVGIRNCFLQVNGFTPAQLVLGQNPRLPSAFNDELPALEGVSSSEIIEKNLNAMASARKAFVRAEISSKIRKALKHPVRKSSDTFYKQGDAVFYKLDVKKEWQGVATVIGIEGKNVVVIKHGSSIRRVHPCRLQKRHPHQFNRDENEKLCNTDGEDDTKGCEEIDKRLNEQYNKDFFDSDLDEASLEGEIPPNNHLTISAGSNNTTEPELHSSSSVLSNDQPSTSAINNDRVSGLDDYPIITEKVPVPKINSSVRYKYRTDQDWNEVTITGRGGKSGGKYQNWLNVRNPQGRTWALDWSDVDNWEQVDEENINACNHVSEITVHLTNSEFEMVDEFHEAKMLELDRLREFNAYEVVPYNQQKTITGRWICTRKLREGEMVPRARFVIRGFQESFGVRVQSDSPTGSKEGLRLILSIIASMSWQIHSIDMKSAFLQGKTLEREVFVIPPVEANIPENYIWKLCKGVYGLIDAARMWYMAIYDKLTILGCMRSDVDYGLFTWYDCNGTLGGVFLSHVDDFVWAGVPDFEKSVISPLCLKFSVGNSCTKTFKYIGINISQKSNCIIIDQCDYIMSVESIPLSKHKQSKKMKFATLMKLIRFVLW